MKNLFDHKKEIHKCSKCGLCQSVCPVYKVTRNDCAVSRGKFIMLNGVVKGDLKLNKNVNKYLDMCLKCNACKDFCPSDIDAREIFLTAKSQYFNSCPTSVFIKGFHSKLVLKTFLNCAKIGANVYRTLKFDKLAKKFYPIFSKFELGKKVILANEFIGNRLPFTVYRSLKQQSSPLANVVYFKGCVNEYINPRTKNAVVNVLDKIGVNVLPVKLNCCGVPFLSSGNVEQFIKQAEYNLGQIPDEFDYFLTDCASCQGAFREYENYIKDEKLLEKLKKINEKSINVAEFIVKNAKSFEFNIEGNGKTTFTFHKPCHLDKTDFIQEFLSKAKNVEYIEMKDFDKCCGFSGEFALKNPEISKEISKEKVQNALETNADYILTSCPACILGLTQGMIENKSNKNLLNFIEFLSNADMIC